MNEITFRKRGRPALLPDDLMKKTIEMIQALRLNGAPVTAAVINAIAKGIVIANDRALLVEHGGYLSLSYDWGRNVLYRMERGTQKDGSQNCYNWEDTSGSWTFEGSETVISAKDQNTTSHAPWVMSKRSRTHFHYVQEQSLFSKNSTRVGTNHVILLQTSTNHNTVCQKI